MRLISVDKPMASEDEYVATEATFSITNDEFNRLMRENVNDRVINKHTEWGLVNKDEPEVPGFRKGKVPPSILLAARGNGKSLTTKELFIKEWYGDLIKDICSNYESKIEKIIFNPPATILFRDGEKYISKCHENDTYDEEKALAITLLKSFGISYLDLKRMISSAKRPYLAKDEMHEIKEPIVDKAVKNGTSEKK